MNPKMAHNCKLDTTNFNNNLDSSITDGQKLAQRINDTTLGSGTVNEFTISKEVALNKSIEAGQMAQIIDEGYVSSLTGNNEVLLRNETHNYQSLLQIRDELVVLSYRNNDNGVLQRIGVDGVNPVTYGTVTSGGGINYQALTMLDKDNFTFLRVAQQYPNLKLEVCTSPSATSVVFGTSINVSGTAIQGVYANQIDTNRVLVSYVDSSDTKVLIVTVDNGVITTHPTLTLPSYYVRGMDIITSDRAAIVADIGGGDDLIQIDIDTVNNTVSSNYTYALSTDGVAFSVRAIDYQTVIVGYSEYSVAYFNVYRMNASGIVRLKHYVNVDAMSYNYTDIERINDTTFMFCYTGAKVEYRIINIADLDNIIIGDPVIATSGNAGDQPRMRIIGDGRVLFTAGRWAQIANFQAAVIKGIAPLKYRLNTQYDSLGAEHTAVTDAPTEISVVKLNEDKILAGYIASTPRCNVSTLTDETFTNNGGTQISGTNSLHTKTLKLSADTSITVGYLTNSQIFATCTVVDSGGNVSVKTQNILASSYAQGLDAIVIDENTVLVTYSTSTQLIAATFKVNNYIVSDYTSMVVSNVTSASMKLSKYNDNKFLLTMQSGVALKYILEYNGSSLSSSDYENLLSATYQSSVAVNDDTAILAYSNTSYTRVYAFKISGSSISEQGSYVQLGSYGYRYHLDIYKLNDTMAIVFYGRYNQSYTYFTILTVDGTAISKSPEYSLGVSPSTMDFTYFDNGKYIIAYNSPYVGLKLLKLTPEVKVENILGIAKETKVAGEQCVISLGPEVDGYTDLLIGEYYYSDEDGRLSLTPTYSNNPVGIALSDTRIKWLNPKI